MGKITEFVRKVGDKAKKAVKSEERSAMKELAKDPNIKISKEPALKDGKKQRYKERVVASSVDKDTGEYTPVSSYERINAKKVAKDVGTGAALTGLAYGAVKGNEKQADIFRELGATDMVTQIKRKLKDGEELTQSEKRLLRLMEA